VKHANIAFFVPHLGCPNRCSFCDQRRISGSGGPPDPREVSRACARAFEGLAGREVEIAFFGGSFTAIPRDKMVSLLEAAFPFVERGLCAGIRISTRPDAVDGETCRILKRYGVTTVELGVQSMDDRVLALNRRGHDSAAVRRAVGVLREHGFFVGLQIMPGLYGDTEETIWRTARETAGLRPDCVRIYPTVVIAGTELERLYRAGLFEPLSLEAAVELCAGLLLFFEEERRIPVIRLGLHASQTLEKDLTAGPYHPAFRELAEGRIFFQRVQSGLSERQFDPKAAVLRVNPRDVSRAVGQRRCNILRLAELGWNIRVLSDGGLSPGEFRLEEEKGQKAAGRRGEEETETCI
jgi:histone acetyltransferase (RNA polymerase elongator complex component)